MIPLFISAFQRAEELAIAMEVRGYDINIKRTSYRLLHWQYKDTLTVLLFNTYRYYIIYFKIFRSVNIAYIS